MKNILMHLFLIASTISFAQVSLPNEFSSGSTISASEMNANFQTLVDAVETLQTEVETLQNQFPLGSIIATFVAPDANGDYMFGSSQWALADGSQPTDSVSTYNGNFPDMRGQFVRGVNLDRADGYEDPDAGSRVGGGTNGVASLQDDAFQGHYHSLTDPGHAHPLNMDYTTFSSGTTSPASSSGDPDIANTDDMHTATTGITIGSPTTDGVNSTPRTASETRPSNIAVYWYIKVK